MRVRFHPPGCDFVASFKTSLSGNANQINAYNWDFGNGTTSSAAAVDSVLFAGPGNAQCDAHDDDFRSSAVPDQPQHHGRRRMGRRLVALA